MGGMSFVLLFVLSASVANGKVIGSYGGSDYGSDSSTSQGYGSDYGDSGFDQETEYETKCTPFTDTVTEDRCEHYQEKVCYTTQQENCQDMEFKSCQPFVSSSQTRSCFNVTELICSLKESVQYDIVQGVFTVQNCRKVKERVCDTVYVPQYTVKDDFQCVSVTKPKCTTEERVVVDKTCREMTTFDCGKVEVIEDRKNEGYGNGGSSGYGSDSDSSSGYGSGSGEPSGYGSGNDYSNAVSTGSGYGNSQPSCKKSYDVKCYTTPRTVVVQKCEQGEEKVCEKLSSRIPLPAEKQVCHDEEKKACDLEQRQQPKQIKKHLYTKQCRSVPRRVCENSDNKSLAPSCVPVNKKRCSYSPVERCEQIPRQHCYTVTRKVQKKKCETVKKTTPVNMGGKDY